MPIKQPPNGQRPRVPGKPPEGPPPRYEWEKPRLEGLPPKKIGSSSVSPDQSREETLYTLGIFCILIATVLAIGGY